MPDLPKSIRIAEVGPRDGLQIEPKTLTPEERIRLIEGLLDTGIREIEVGSYVNAKAVPQMANSDKVLDGLSQRDGVLYRMLYLNIRGLELAIASGRADIEGRLTVNASDVFSRRNINRSIDESFAELPKWIAIYRSAGVEATNFVVPAAFGCNFEGYIPQEKVLGLIERAARIMADEELQMKNLELCDTMGWANPLQVKRMIGAVRDRWPDLAVKLHMHDTRGSAIANCVAAMELGVAEFESAVGGLGGCPFSGHKGAAGNVCTEDLVFVAEEMGISTGINLDGLIECTRMVEKLVGHSVPSKMLKGGTLDSFRQKNATA